MMKFNSLPKMEEDKKSVFFLHKINKKIVFIVKMGVVKFLEAIHMLFLCYDCI